MSNTSFPDLPKLMFFDTNIVQNLSSFGELIYDQFLSDEIERKIFNLGQRFSDDIFALKDFMELGQRMGWNIAVSPNILDEHTATAQLGKRVRLLDWDRELAYYFHTNLNEPNSDSDEPGYRGEHHFTAIQRSRLAEMLSDLPQEADRQLVIDAREYGCDIFLTMDYKTIWRHRACVDPLGISVMRPIELIEHISPWARLLK